MIGRLRAYKEALGLMVRSVKVTTKTAVLFMKLDCNVDEGALVKENKKTSMSVFSGRLAGHTTHQTRHNTESLMTEWRRLP